MDTIISDIVAVEVGAQVVQRRLAHVVVLFSTAVGDGLCAAFDVQKGATLIHALTEYMQYSHAHIADLDEQADALHASCQGRSPALTRARLDQVMVRDIVTKIEGRATVQRLALDLWIGGCPITFELPAPMVDVLVGYVMNVFQQFDESGLLLADAGATAH